MTEPVPATGTVHWIGTGLSTGTGLSALCDRAERVVVWGRTEAKATACAARTGAAGRAEVRAYTPDALTAELAPGDVVVSMLPAGEHATVLRCCLDRRAHFACTSYTAPDLAAAADDARAAGLVVLTEAGLDPGMDHLLAHELIARARDAVGPDEPVRAAFASYCGGLPAVPNEFRYRFSWAPKGVLTALRSPARYISDGAETVVEHPWEATEPLAVGGETFEVYPNRDSLPFVGQYAIPPTWSLDTFVRGTLRLDGWRDAWAPVFAELTTADDERIGALADELAGRYPTTDHDRDRVVLSVALTVSGANGRRGQVRWSGESFLSLVGDEADSAMARCVSVTLACGVADVLAGEMGPGLNRAVHDRAAVARWLAFLREHGVACEFTVR